MNTPRTDVAGPLPWDPALPHLGFALDGTAMAGQFARWLPGRTVRRCEVDRVKYRPRRNLSVSYRLEVADGAGPVIEQRVSTRWCRGGEAARRHRDAQRRPAVPSAAGPDWTHEPRLDLCAAWAPNDPKLPALAELLDGERLRGRWLPEVLEAAGLRPRPGAAPRATLVQWVPEHRACSRVELDADGTGGAPLALYAKACLEHAGADTHELAQALHASGRVRAPRPLLWQASSGLHWQEAVPGAPLAAQRGELEPVRAARVGALMAALHGTPLPAARGLTPDDLRRQREQVAHTLGLIEPRWQPVLHRIVAALERGARQALGAPMATLHGDLHRGNVIEDHDGSLSLIDLDGVHRAPAVLELGSWIADSMLLALLEGRTAASCAPACRVLLGAYRDAGATLPGEAALAWATAHQLLCQRAWRSAINLKPGRFALVGDLLQLARTLALAGSPDAVMPWPEAA